MTEDEFYIYSTAIYDSCITWRRVYVFFIPMFQLWVRGTVLALARGSYIKLYSTHLLSPRPSIPLPDLYILYSITLLAPNIPRSILIFELLLRSPRHPWFTALQHNLSGANIRIAPTFFTHDRSQILEAAILLQTWPEHVPDFLFAYHYLCIWTWTYGSSIRG